MSICKKIISAALTVVAAASLMAVALPAAAMASVDIGAQPGMDGNTFTITADGTECDVDVFAPTSNKSRTEFCVTVPEGAKKLAFKSDTFVLVCDYDFRYGAWVPGASAPKDWGTKQSNQMSYDASAKEIVIDTAFLSPYEDTSFSTGEAFRTDGVFACVTDDWIDTYVFVKYAAAAAPAQDAVIAAIDEMDATSKDSVAAAREAYDALTAEQQALVTNYVKLVEAEKAIAVADKDAAEQAAKEAAEKAAAAEQAAKEAAEKAEAAEQAAAQATTDKQAAEQAATQAAADKKAADEAATKAAADKKAADEALAKAQAELVTAKATVAAQASQVKGLKAKSKKAKVTASWKKASGADGYQVAYKKASAKKFKTAKTTKAKFSKKLKKGKTYVVKVRSFKKIDGKVVYGQWTDLKTVKCK